MNPATRLGVRNAVRICGAVLLCLAAVCADDSVWARAAWPDSFVARVEALALLQTLNADLLSHDSATATLERWCDVHRLASPPRIVAERVTGMDKAPTPEQRLELGVTPAEPVRYRRVRLRCGGVVLSEADNWYVPGRLTAQMNTLLDTTDTPFGKVVQALHFQRRTLFSKLLWSPLPEGWEMNHTAASGGAAELRVPPELLEHRAVLALPDGTPISEVVETYTGNVLAFPMPQPPEPMTDGDTARMSGHMYMTTLRPLQAGDREKADALVESARAAMAPYLDYRKALSDGYEIFLPNVPQSQYHFTKYEYAREARLRFDSHKPTSLLYTKTADGGYKLVGAMYTDRVDAMEDELNDRIPLSIARWHQHINFCKAPAGQKAAYFGPEAKFGLRGSITTTEACEAAGGEFHPHLFGWMVHVYPYEADPKNIWSTDDDEQGHDNMDHSAMPGMKMDTR